MSVAKAYHIKCDDFNVDVDVPYGKSDEAILFTVFNNNKSVVEAKSPNSVKDVKLRVTSLQYIDVVIDNKRFKLFV